MASCSVSEKDFEHVAYAARILWDHGDKKGAVVLDELARKINGALTTASSKMYRVLGGNHGLKRPSIKSPLEEAGLR